MTELTATICVKATHLWPFRTSYGVLGGLEATDIFTKTTKFTQIRDIKYIFLDFNNLLWQKNPLLLGPAAVRPE